MAKEVEELEYQILYHLRSLLKEETTSGYAEYLAVIGHYISKYADSGGDFVRLFNYPENIEPILQSLFMEGLFEKIEELKKRFGDRFPYFEKISAEILFKKGDEKGAWEKYLLFLRGKLPESRGQDVGSPLYFLKDRVISDAERDHFFKMELSLYLAVYLLLKDPSPDRIKEFYGGLNSRTKEKFAHLSSFCEHWSEVDSELQKIEEGFEGEDWGKAIESLSMTRHIFKRRGRTFSKEVSTITESLYQMLIFMKGDEFENYEVPLRFAERSGKDRVLLFVHLLYGDISKAINIYRSGVIEDREERRVIEGHLIERILDPRVLHPPNVYSDLQDILPLDRDNRLRILLLESFSMIKEGCDLGGAIQNLEPFMRDEEGREYIATSMMKIIEDGYRGAEALHIVPFLMPSHSSFAIVESLSSELDKEPEALRRICAKLISSINDGWFPDNEELPLLEKLFESAGMRAEYELSLFLKESEKMEQEEVYDRLKTLFARHGFDPLLLKIWQKIPLDFRAEKFFDDEFPNLFIIEMFKYNMAHKCIESAFDPFFKVGTVGRFIEITGAGIEDIPSSLLTDSIKVFMESMKDEELRDRFFELLGNLFGKIGNREILRRFVLETLRGITSNQERLERLRFCVERFFPHDKEFILIWIDTLKEMGNYRETSEIFKRCMDEFGEEACKRWFLKPILEIIVQMCLSDNIVGARSYLFDLHPEKWLEDNPDAMLVYSFLLWMEWKKKKDRRLIEEFDSLKIEDETFQFILSILRFLSNVMDRTRESISSYLSRMEKEIDYYIKEKEKVESQLSSHINTFTGRYREALKDGITKNKDSSKIIENFEDIYKRENKEIPPKSQKAIWENKIKKILAVSAKIKTLEDEVKEREGLFPVISGLRWRREGIVSKLEEIDAKNEERFVGLIIDYIKEELKGE